jgi:hypothetical protein
MTPNDVTPEMYADWVCKTYSNVTNELAWLFTLIPKDQQEYLQDSIYDDIIDGTYTPFAKED